MPETPSEIIRTANIREHFQQSVQSALHNQQVDAEQETVVYIVNLLTEFSRAEYLFDRTEHGVDLKPLAFLYGEAVEAGRAELRNRALKRLGDLALFIAGMYADSLNRKTVDVDYYIAMGGNAYGYLSDVMRGTLVARAYGPIFEELARKFTDFVDVLGEVSEQARTSSDADILRTYEVWLRTGSKRAARRLATLGIQPSEYASSRLSH